MFLTCRFRSLRAADSSPLCDPERQPRTSSSYAAVRSLQPFVHFPLGLVYRPHVSGVFDSRHFHDGQLTACHKASRAGKTPVSHKTRAIWRHTRRRFESTAHEPHTYRHRHTHHATTHTHKYRHTQHMRTPTHTQHFRQNPDNIDCRHKDHLAPHKVQAMQLAKNMKTHNSQFWLFNEQHWLQSNMTAVCPRLFEILTTLTFGALRKKTH